MVEPLIAAEVQAWLGVIIGVPLVFVVLYFVIRLGVRHGMRDYDADVEQSNGRV